MTKKSKNWEFEVVNPNNDDWAYMKELASLVLTSHASIVVLAEWTGTLRGFVQFVSPVEDMPKGSWMMNGYRRPCENPIAAYWKLNKFNNAHCQVNLGLVEHQKSSKQIKEFEWWIETLPHILDAPVLKHKFSGVRQTGKLATMTTLANIKLQRESVDGTIIDIINRSKSVCDAAELSSLNDELVKCTVMRGNLLKCVTAMQAIEDEVNTIKQDMEAMECRLGKRKREEQKVN